MARTYKPVSAGTLSARKAEKGAADMPRVGPPQLHIYIYIYSCEKRIDNSYSSTPVFFASSATGGSKSQKAKTSENTKHDWTGLNKTHTHTHTIHARRRLSANMTHPSSFEEKGTTLSRCASAD